MPRTSRPTFKDVATRWSELTGQGPKETKYRATLLRSAGFLAGGWMRVGDSDIASWICGFLAGEFAQDAAEPALRLFEARLSVGTSASERFGDNLNFGSFLALASRALRQGSKFEISEISAHADGRTGLIRYSEPGDWHGLVFRSADPRPPGPPHPVVTMRVLPGPVLGELAKLASDTVRPQPIVTGD